MAQQAVHATMCNNTHLACVRACLALQGHITQDWLVGVALDNASQWKDVVQTALQAAVVLLLLERLNVMRPEPWLEQ